MFGMKKGLLYIFVLVCSVWFFSGCMKSSVTLSTTPSMTATIGGTYTFNATSITPATVKPQLNDSAEALIITGYDVNTGYKMILSVTKYKNIEGTFSIVEGQADGVYYHDGITELATGGVVAIKDVSNVVNGYFSFTSASGLAITNGTFTVGNPWVY